MDRAIDAALALIEKDLLAAGAPVPRVEPTAWQDWAPSESVMLLAADGSAMGVWLDLSVSEAERLAHLADQVQEWAVEELARLGRPTNWPVCPAHPANHPLTAVAQDGQAVWTCPKGAAVRTAVGRVSRE